MRFTVFGIPVHVDLFFFVGLLMVWSWAGGERSGVFAAVFVGVFTLIHELGHALTARRFGAQSAITLNLLVGWASYAAPQPLTRRQRNLISLAGPLSQIVLAVPVLVVTYYALPEQRSAEAAAVARGAANLPFDMWQGAVWAGIVIGLLNLMPLWPLDGGHVLDSFLTTALGERRGRRAMLIGTLVVVGVVAVLGFSTGTIEAPYSGIEREVLGAAYAPYAALAKSLPAALWEQIRYFPGHILDFPLLLVLFCGLNSALALQRMPKHDRVATWIDVEQAPKRPDKRRPADTAPAAPAPAPTSTSVVPAEAHHAERYGWLDSQSLPFPSGWGPSPWLRSYLALQGGDTETARAVARTVSAGGRPRWELPDPAERPELAQVAALLDVADLRVEDPERSMVTLRVLAAHGSPEQIATFGVALYGATSDAEVLFVVAAGLARCGLGDDAMDWLRRAVMDRPDHRRLATDRGFWPLHPRDDFQHLLESTKVES